MGTIDDFEGTLFCPVHHVVANGDAVLVFEMILNGLGSKRRVWTKFGEDFIWNELFINVAMSSVEYAMTGMSLNWLSNLPNVGAGEWGGIEVPIALFVFAFESIMIVVDPVGDKFIDIEEGGTGACVL